MIENEFSFAHLARARRADAVGVPAVAGTAPRINDVIVGSLGDLGARGDRLEGFVCAVIAHAACDTRRGGAYWQLPPCIVRCTVRPLLLLLLPVQGLSVYQALGRLVCGSAAVMRCTVRPLLLLLQGL